MILRSSSVNGALWPVNKLVAEDVSGNMPSTKRPTVLYMQHVTRATLPRLLRVPPPQTSTWVWTGWMFIDWMRRVLRSSCQLAWLKGKRATALWGRSWSISTAEVSCLRYMDWILCCVTTPFRKRCYCEGVNEWSVKRRSWPISRHTGLEQPQRISFRMVGHSTGFQPCTPELSIYF
jgi:hypothetical protein